LFLHSWISRLNPGYTHLPLAAKLNGIIIKFFKECNRLYRFTSITALKPIGLFFRMEAFYGDAVKKKVAHRNEPPVKGGQNEAL
jgi:hypothetical protein